MAEGHSLEGHMPLRRRQRFGIGGVLHFRHHAHQAVQLLQVHRPLLDLPPGPAENVQRRIEGQQHQHHRRQVANLHRPLDHVPGRQHHHRQKAQVHHQRLHRVQHIHAAVGVHIMLVVIGHRIVKPAGFAGFGGEGFHGLEIGQDVHRSGPEMGVGLIHLPALAHPPFGDDHRADNVKRNRRHRDQRKADIIGNPKGHRGQHQPHQRRPNVERQEADQIVNRAGAPLDDPVQRPGPPRLVKAQRQGQRMPERVHTRHPLRVLAHRREQPVPHLRQGRSRKAQHQPIGQPQGRRRKVRRHAPLRHGLVDGMAHHQRRNHLQDGGRQGDDDGQRHHRPPFGKFRTGEQIQDAKDRFPQAAIGAVDTVMVFGRRNGSIWRAHASHMALFATK